VQFQPELANETWESIYIGNDTNNKFNSFLYILLNTFEASFPVSQWGVKLITHLHLVPRSKNEVELYIHFPNTLSWRGA
jgi:hypothetical protein